MAAVLLAMAVVWGLGAAFAVPRRTRVMVVAALFMAVLAVQLALPEAHPLRQVTGGSPRSWLVLAGVIVAGAGYMAGLSGLRRRVPVPNPGTETAGPGVPPPFSDIELDRYARHIVLREIGGPGQRRLKAARVLVIGAGGLGSPALLYLAAAGVGTIGVIDDDVVENANLQRQIVHADARIGMPKVFSALIAMQALNPFITVRPYHRRLIAAEAAALFADYDLILDGSDTFATRAMVNAAAVATGTPLIAAAITQWEGQISLYHPASGAPCLACIFPHAPAPGLAPACAEAGVVGALPGVIGSIMALEAIKWITGAGASLCGRMLIHDALFAESRVITLHRDPACPVCALSPGDGAARLGSSAGIGSGAGSGFGPNAGPDAGPDAGPEAGPEAGTEAGPEAGHPGPQRA